MKFLAEIRRVSSKKLITSDNEVTLLLSTNDFRILDLGKYPSDTLFEVDIKVEGESVSK